MKLLVNVDEVNKNNLSLKCMAASFMLDSKLQHDTV